MSRIAHNLVITLLSRTGMKYLIFTSFDFFSRISTFMQYKEIGRSKKKKSEIFPLVLIVSLYL